MSKNCIKSISTEEFVTLKNAENTEKFYKCKTEYKTYLKSLDKKIIAMQKGLESGKIVLGHSFWSKDFCP